jgi:hypothetical protein
LVPCETGAQQGGFSGIDKEFELKIDNVSKTGLVTVSVSHRSFDISPSSREVKVYYCINLPKDAIKMLRTIGKSTEEIIEIDKTIKRICPEEGINGKWDGTRGDSTFRLFEGIASEIAKPNADFLRINYKNNLKIGDKREHLAKIVEDMSPGERDNLAKNWDAFGQGTIGYDYVNGCFLANMHKFAYYTTDIQKTLGLKIYPAHRQPNGQDDPLGERRPGCFSLGNLSIAIEKGVLNSADISRAKELVNKIYAMPPNYSEDELKEFKAFCKDPRDGGKVPNYYFDGAVYHEHYDGHTLYLVPSGKFHSGNEGGGKAVHTGGHNLLGNNVDG